MPRITDLTAQTGANVDVADLLVTTDVSDTTQASTGTNKKLTFAELLKTWFTVTPTAVKTASTYTAAPGDLVVCDTTSNAITVTLPTAPAEGTQVAVKLVIKGGTNSVTIATGGSDVFDKAGGLTSLSLSVAMQSVTFRYATSGAIWYAIASNLPNQAMACRAYFSSGTQSVANTTVTAVTFDAENFDTPGMHSTGSNTSRFTVPAGMAGLWIFTGQIGYPSVPSGTVCSAVLKLNGSTTLADKNQSAGSRSGVFAYDTTQTSLTNPTGLTTLLASAPAFASNTLALGDTLHITASGLYTNNAASTTLELELLLGGIGVFDYVTGTLTSSASARRWSLDANITISTIGASANVDGEALFFISAAGAAAFGSQVTLGAGASGDGALLGVGTGASTFDSTASATLDLKAKLGTTSTGATVSLRQFSVVQNSLGLVTGQNPRVAVNDQEVLAAGDYVELMAYQNTGGSVNLETGAQKTFLAATYIGPT